MDDYKFQMALDSLRLCIFAVFGAAVVPKLLNPRAFVTGVVEYDVLPKSLAVVFGMLLIPIELAVAIAHLVDFELPIASASGLVLLLCFAVAIGVNLKRKRTQLPCFCFGSIAVISVSSLTRISMLIIAEAIILYLATRSTLASSASLACPTVRQLCDTIPIAVSLLLLPSWLLRFPDILILAGRNRNVS